MPSDRTSTASFLTLAISIAASVSSLAPASTGPIGHWTFNEGRGTLLGDSAGRFPGTALGAPIFVPGVDGTALTFSRATQDRVDVGNIAAFDFAGSTGMSVSFWVKYPVGTAADHYPVSNHTITSFNGWICFTGVSGGCYGDPERATFYVSAGCGAEVTAPQPLYDGAWHHIVAVLDGGTKRLFIDGGPADAQAPSGSFGVHPLSRLVFGGLTTTQGQSFAAFDGTLDDVQIYNRALSCAEVNFLRSNPGATVPLLPDLDENGTVDAADLAILLGAWGGCEANCGADFDCSGTIDAADLAVLLGAWTN